MESSQKTVSVSFFLEGKDVPSSRFRVCQYQKAFAEDGVESINLYTRPNKYLFYPPVVRGTVLEVPWAIGSLGWIVAQRCWQIASYMRSDSIVFLQRDLLYRISVPFLERFLFFIARKRKVRRIVFDLDDAIFLGKGGVESPGLKAKLETISRYCDAVIAGNQFLADQISMPEKVVIIPTTIPMDRYLPRSFDEIGNEVPVIGWTGVASNLGYLTTLEGVLNEIAEKHRFAMHIVCEGGTPSPFQRPQFPVQMIEWSSGSETEALRSFDIGLMPLTDDVWSRGKCGFKLLQYMAVGVASIASPVGVNREIVSDGQNGMLANNEREWSVALEALLSSAETRKKLALSGRETILNSYSSDIWYPNWRDTVLGIRDESRVNEDSCR